MRFMAYRGSQTLSGRNQRIIQPLPVERRAGIGLPAGRYVRMGGQFARIDLGVRCSKRLDDPAQNRVLRIGIGRVVSTFQLDANGEIVAT